MTKRASVLVLTSLAIVSAACARHANDAEIRAHFQAKQQPSAPPPQANEAGMYPTPFTADQIRDATKAGRTYKYKIETAGQPTGERVMTFVKVDATGADLVTDGGAPTHVTWEELRQHAEFPKPVVTTREEKTTTPAGTFDCVVYIVQSPGENRTFYFAKSLPGAPVLFFTEKDGKRVMTSTLIDHKPGK